MPRRRVLTDEQLEELLALPVTETLLVQHWTLSPADLTVVERRRGDPNQLGFALQLCAFRYPGRLLWSDEAIPALALRFVADQLGVAPGALTAYGTRPQTRREQLDALRAAFGFAMFAPEHQRELLTWLLPAALGTADTMAVAEALMGELRRRKILAPGPSVIERLVAVAWMLAERQIARQLTGDLLPAQATALEGLLTIKGGTAMSALAWARQPPGVPGHRALARLIEQRAILQAIALDPAGAEGVHPERLRKLAREGARFTAQHLRDAVASAPSRDPDRDRARYDYPSDRRYRRPGRPRGGAHVPPRRDPRAECPAARYPGDQRQGAPAGKAGNGVDRGPGKRRRFAVGRGFRDRLGQAGPQCRGGGTPGAPGQNRSPGPGRAGLAGVLSAITPADSCVGSRWLHPSLRGVDRDALPEMPIDGRAEAARADGAGISSVPLSGLHEAVQRSERWFAEPDAISERRDRARSALAAPLQAQPARSGRDVPDPRRRVQL